MPDLYFKLQIFRKVLPGNRSKRSFQIIQHLNFLSICRQFKDMTLSELMLEMESTYDVYVDANTSAHKTRPILSFVSPSLTMVVAIFLISCCCCCKGKKCPTCSCVRYLPNCMRKQFQKKNGNKTVRWRKSSSERWRQVHPIEAPTSDSDCPKLYPILFGKNLE